MIRLIVIGALLYLAWRIFRTALGKGPANISQGRQPAGQIDDVMVQDPKCQVYFPRREGFAAKVDGQTHYFCSEKCRDEFLADHKAK
jgi:YHS domain-containing protein